MTPANFPEKKRQRQLRALARLSAMTKGNPRKGTVPHTNDGEATILRERTAAPLRDKRTKKDRAGRGRLTRAT